MPTYDTVGTQPDPKKILPTKEKGHVERHISNRTFHT
jgi:hypothetical protein